MISDFENKAEPGFRFRCPYCKERKDENGVIVHDPLCPIRAEQRRLPRRPVRNWNRVKEFK